MPKYGFDVENMTTPITTPDTVLALTANGAGEEAEIIELMMTGSGEAAAADRQHRAKCVRNDPTTGPHGTSSAIVPAQFEEFSRAAQCDGSGTFTVEPATLRTIGLVQFGFNQRGGHRWAVPRGEGIKIRNADTDEGIAWHVESDAAGNVDANIQFWEP